MSSNSAYRNYIADRIRSSSVELADSWLRDLENVVNEDLRDVFPTKEYLDHIPSMINEIASILKRPGGKSPIGNSVIDRKAIQLGTLRHRQQASVSQLLREYELLAYILEDFVAEKTSEFQGEVNQQDLFDLMSCTSQVVRFILKSTVEAFVEKYMGTIQEQTERIVSFNRFVSHELKTPLQSALLNMELLMEDRDVSQVDTPELLRVQTSIQQASLLLRNIETLTENTDDAIEDNPVRQVIDVSSVVCDIESQLAETCRDKGVSIRVHKNLGEIVIDVAKFKLIVTNLLTNAIKYSDPGKEGRYVSIDPIEASTSAQDDESLNLGIRDNGLGIDSSMQKAIFKLRVRAHSDKDQLHDVSGHGLGLYLVSEAVSDLGGTIELDSVVGEGTEIRLRIPRH